MIAIDPAPGLPGDPSALRVAARSLGGAASDLTEQAAQLLGATSTVGSAWTGEASTAWRSLGARHHEQLTVAAGAFRDAAGALAEYANRLEDAQRAHALATASADALTRRAMTLAGQPDQGGQATELDALRTDIGRAGRAADAAAGDARAAARIAAAQFEQIAARAPRDLQACPALVAPTGASGQAPTESALTVLLGSVRSGSSGEPVELDLEDPVAVRGASREAIGEVARAQGWEAVPAKRGGGACATSSPARTARRASG